jgi:hypothetical protein
MCQPPPEQRVVGALCTLRENASDNYRTDGKQMIRTGPQYRDSIRDGRQVWINGKRVKDVTTHPMFRPLVDVRACIYDMQHDHQFADALCYCGDAGEICAIALKLPRTGGLERQTRRG